MRMEEPYYNISMYFYNKNVLKYAQIIQSGLKSMIRNIEGRSNILSNDELEVMVGSQNNKIQNKKTMVKCSKFKTNIPPLLMHAYC